MSATVLYMSISLDGFIAGPNERLDNGLGDGGDRLILEGHVGDLLVIFCDMQETQIGSEAETCEKLLPKTEAVKRVQNRQEVGVGTVRRLPVVVEFEGDRCTGGKGLREDAVHLRRVQVQGRNAEDRLIRQRRR